MMKAFLFDKNSLEIRAIPITRMAATTVTLDLGDSSERGKWLYRSNEQHEILDSFTTAVQYKVGTLRAKIAWHQKQAEELDKLVQETIMTAKEQIANEVGSIE